MKTARHILPAVCITGFIVVIFLLFYKEIYKYEEDKCWQELDETAEQVISEVTAEFEDDVAKLHIMETVLKNDNLENQDVLQVLYLESVLPTTMFSRIHIWYPDNTLISSGDKNDVLVEASFEETAALGEHMTTRKTDPQTGNQTIYYILPISENENTLAILIGVIDLSAISESFRPTIYHGEGNIGIIDSKDGSFLIDTWHEELGNAYEMTDRKMARGYEDIDLIKKMKNLETGVGVFESKTTGESLYMYFTPTDIFDWQLVIFAPESVIFGSLINFSKELLSIGTIIILLLILYFFWNIKTVRLLNQKVVELENQKELLKTISHTDALTLIANRMKYIEDCNSLKGKQLKKTGVIYLDLNGLKQINDLQSHELGDEYIKKAAEILSRQFKDECYRTGGDEFVVLTVDIERDAFETGIAAVRKAMSESGVSISIGCHWEERCSNLKKMCMEAEKQMYLEKKAYYQTLNRGC